MAILCIRKQAHGRNAKEEKLAVSAIQSVLSFLIPLQEGALWPSSVIRLGPHWCNSKITWAVQYWMLTLIKHYKVTILSMVRELYMYL